MVRDRYDERGSCLRSNGSEIVAKNSGQGRPIGQFVTLRSEHAGAGRQRAPGDLVDYALGLGIVEDRVGHAAVEFAHHSGHDGVKIDHQGVDCARGGGMRRAGYLGGRTVRLQFVETRDHLLQIAFIELVEDRQGEIGDLPVALVRDVRLADTLALIRDEPRLKIVLKEFPILGRGSTEAARVAIAARMQDPAKYLAFHRALLSAPGPASEQKALGVAMDQGFDLARLEKDMASDEVAQTLAEDMKLASALGFSGTPSYVVGDEMVTGAVGVAALKDRIRRVRATEGLSP